MKYQTEYRDAQRVKQWADALYKITTQPWTIMEVCGGQTHSIVKYGIQELIPPSIELIHGPGCPVCVTPIHLIDHALFIAKQPMTILCSYGDMLRVPGTSSTLLIEKAKGADVRIVLSPLDAVEIALQNPQKQIVFFAVGFETTAPPNGMAVLLAAEQGIDNFSLLASHVLVPPALNVLFNSPGNRIQGVLAAGHVCTIMGDQEYTPLASTYHIPIVITGFEPLDIMQGLYACISQLENGKARVENQYRRSVHSEGNLAAQSVLKQVFTVVDQVWRGMGSLPQSGLTLAATYAKWDASKRFPFQALKDCEPSLCQSGLVLKGEIKPVACPLFGKECTPENPVGAPMVSHEGACSAYYRFGRSPQCKH